jgi:hypothetical protein
VSTPTFMNFGENAWIAMLAMDKFIPAVLERPWWIRA